MVSLFGSKKGFSIENVPMLAIMLVMIAVVLGVGATVLGQIQSTQTAGGAAYNATGQGLVAIQTLSGWQNTWAVIIAAAVVIGIIGTYLFLRNN